MSTEHGGLKRPERRLELLWRGRERPSRGPKPRLTLERIVRAAVEIADADGLAALSMRRVAEKLGVGVMSLYRYVPGKDELIDVMFDTVIGESAQPEGVPGDWRAQLEWRAREDWALYHRHPWILQVSVSRPPLGPNVLMSFESTLGAAWEAGLPSSDVVAVAELIDNYVRGAAGNALEAVQIRQSSGVSDEEWWLGHASVWERYFDPSRFPLLTKCYEQGAFDQYGPDTVPNAALFEFGLQRVLDGIEVLIRQRRAEAGPNQAHGR